MAASLNKAKTISLIIAPSITGCISSFASISLIVSILRSNQKLSTVYRRLIFCLSAFDVIQSISQGMSSLPMPTGTVWGAIGNDVTCDIQGFLIATGFCGTVLYSLSLTVYFLLVVKYDMSEAKIKKYAEPFLHAVPIVYSLIGAISMYGTNNYNSAGPVCWIAPEPLNCENDPEVECLSSGNSGAMKWIFAGGPLFGVFFVNCTILALIWRTYRSQAQRNQSYGNSPASRSSPRAQVKQGDEEEQEGKCFPCCPTQQCPITINRSKSQSNTPRRPSILADYLSRPSRASVRRLEEISRRAAAYVIGFMLCYIFTLIYRLIEMYGSVPTPYAIIILSRIFFPLQGFFNVIIYTYPHVTSYRRNHSECNWFEAFWNVVKTGGDSDETRTGRTGRRGSGIRI